MELARAWLMEKGLRVFCVGKRCFLLRWPGLVFFAPVTSRCFLRRFLGVFCDGPGCLLHWQPVFFATVVFSALVSGVFCHGNRGILRQLEGGLNANTTGCPRLVVTKLRDIS